MRGWWIGSVAALVGVALVAGTAAADEDVNVAVIDSGIDTSHDAFCEGQIEVWMDLVNRAHDPYDDYGHGTMVASRVGGQSVGWSSPLGAYPCVDLHVYKVLDDSGSASSATVNDAIYQAVENEADVIVLSLSGSLPYPPGSVSRSGAVGYAAEQGVLVVSSAGNDGELPPPSDPSALGHGPAEAYHGRNSPSALIVGASDGEGERASFSQRNPEMLAPGEDVELAHPYDDDGTYRGSGTSYSTPWVGGVAAQMLAEGAPNDPDWLKWVILHAADDEVTTPYANEGYGVFAEDERKQALDVARGQAPLPGPDHRDAEHAASLALRTGMTLEEPAGLLPPFAPPAVAGG